MLTRQKIIDYLHDSPVKVLISICFPLIGVNIVLALSTLLTNALYTNFVGDQVFSIMGYLSAVTTSFGSIISSIMFSAWIKTAHHFSFDSKPVAEHQMFNGIAAITLVDIGLALTLLLFTNPVLKLLSIPDAIYSDAKLYYILTIISYLPVSLAALFLTIVNGTSSAPRLFWVNIMVVCTNTLTAVLLLVVFRTGMTGVALMPATGAILQLICYYFLFRKEGFSFNFKEIIHGLDHAKIRSIIRNGFLIALQSLLCTTGYLIVTYQANRYLSLEYISVLNISLPLSGIISAVSSASLAFCPPNYAAYKFNRLKQFFILSTLCCLGYGIICFLLYAFLGNQYYGSLFRDPVIVAYGSEYWIWFGLGQIFLALLSNIRTFFDSVGKSNLSLLSGIGELAGNLICALILIPLFGNIGRSLAYTLGYFLAATFLLVAYFLFRKEIYANNVQ